MKVTPLERFLNHSRTSIEKLTSEATYEEVRIDAIELYNELELVAPSFKRNINRDNFRHGTSGLALYKALLKTAGLDREQAIAIMREAIAATVREELDGSWLKRLMLRSLARSKVMASTGAKAFVALDEPRGWLAELPDTDAHWAFDVRQCGLVLYLTEHEAPELCHVFCDSDHVAAEFMKGLRFERSGTLAEGAAVCDFRYYRVSS